MENAWIAMVVGIVILVASMASVELGISVALIEIVLGVVAGNQVEAIVTAAREGGFELVVVGFAGHTNLYGRVMGSTAQNLSRLSPCNLLIAR